MITLPPVISLVADLESKQQNDQSSAAKIGAMDNVIYT